MPNLPPPEAKAHVGETFTKQLNALAAHAQQGGLETTSGVAPLWYRPDGFEGTLFDAEGLSDSLSRQEQVNDFLAAVTSAKGSGTTTDLQLVQLQGDFLGCIERAYRLRHQTACRSRIHASGRLLGHGDPYGPVRLGLLGHVVDLDRVNKGEPSS